MGVSAAMNNHTDVALILFNSDVIDLMSFVLLGADLRSCGFEPSEGAERVEEFISSHRPGLVIFDLDPPYRKSTVVLKGLLNRFPDLPFVITCADPMLAIKAAPWLSCHPVFQKPYEPDEIRDVVGSILSRARRHLGKKAATVGDFCPAK
jgi:DNA-binding NtrC family response regulator